jgi:hypothetical protein
MNISINQGNLFNKYQKKIKENTINKSKRKVKTKNVLEGFTNNTDLINEYDNTLNDYQDIYNKSQTEINNYTARVSPNNPFLGKNVRLTGTGAIGYVTNDGIYKWYNSWDTIDKTESKNGCPASSQITNIDNDTQNYKTYGSIIDTQPDLLTGTPMQSGQSCGNEKSNVYVTYFSSNNSSSYKGCYALIPQNVEINIIPNSYSATIGPGYNYEVWASSIYKNNEAYGPAAAFDTSPDTFWHSSTDAAYQYNTTTGIYQNTTSHITINAYNGLTKIYGEFLAAKMPPGLSDIIQGYNITPRPESPIYTYRSPNTWYLLARIDGGGTNWNVVDYQENQQFLSNGSKSYSTSFNKTKYSQFAIIITKVGNDDQTDGRYCVQIGNLDLYKYQEDTNNTNSNSNPPMDLITGDGQTMNKTDCQKLSTNLGYKYFGIGKSNTGSSEGQCYGSNDLDKMTINGEVSYNIIMRPVWTPNTYYGDYSPWQLSVTTEGKISIKNPSNQEIIWEKGGITSCLMGGGPNPDSVQASYGGNCIGKPLNIDCGGGASSSESYTADGIQGNLTNIYKNIFIDSYSNPEKFNAQDNNSFSFNALDGWGGGDPAHCCSKMVDYSYQCGGNEFKTASVSPGATINIDCVSEKKSCVFFLILQDDGNLALYQGSDPNDQQGNAIWYSGTNGLQGNPTTEYEASKGKYGRNYIKTNEYLGPNEWIGTTNGSMQLLMDGVGNLLIYSSLKKEACYKNGDDTIGTSNSVATYDNPTPPILKNFGELGYIDGDGILHPYPNDMLELMDQYLPLGNDIDVPGNDLSGMQFPNYDEDKCASACNSNPNCYGYTYGNNSNVCYLKNSNINYKTGMSYLKNYTSKLRKKTIISSNPSCGSSRTFIDTIQYENYIKGPNMNTDYDCSEYPISDSTKSSLQLIQDKLTDLGNKIIGKTNTASGEGEAIYSTMDNQKKIASKDMKEYSKIQKQINFLEENEIKEGMNNLVDIQAMENDTSLWVNMENSEFILWTFITLGLISITIFLSSKRKK